jgi:hypothetical protein
VRAFPFALAPDDAERLESVLAASVRALRDGLAREPGGPWEALAVYVGQDPEWIVPGPVDLCSVQDRARALAVTDPAARRRAAWVPAEWQATDELDWEMPDDLDVVQEGLVDLIQDLETVDPHAWVAEEVCHRLVRSDPANVTAAFVAFPTDGWDGADVPLTIADLAPGPVRERLVACGLLPARLGDGPTRAPDPGGAATVPAADVVVSGITAGLREALIANTDGGPWPAMAVRTGWGRDGPLPSDLVLCPPARRVEALAHRDHLSRVGELRDRLSIAWTSDWWHSGSGGGEDEGGEEPDPLDDPGEIGLEWSDGLLAAAGVAFDDLEAAGVEEPAFWLAAEACRRLMVEGAPNATEDFVAFPPRDHLGPGGLMATLAEIVPAATLERLETQGLFVRDVPEP